MSRFLRKGSAFVKGRSSLIGALAVSAFGSGLFYAGTNSDSCTKVSIVVPEAVGDSLSLPWQLISRGIFTCPSWGSLPLFISSFSLAPPAGTDKERALAFRDGPENQGAGCFGRDTIANAAARVGPAVVNLSIDHVLFGVDIGKRIGSGTIISSDGTILTCAHVVTDLHGTKASSKRQVDVTLQDGRTFKGTVINSDRHSDIAIVKIDSKTPLPTATLGSSGKLRPGDWVVALGCPLSLQNTVTAGIISCVDRKSSDLGFTDSCVDHKSSDLGFADSRRVYLQTDCAINLGNSGGPLVNMDGEVVGVNVFKAAAADGLAFAVPIDSVVKIIEGFKKSGRVVRPWLGLKMVDLNKMLIAQLKEKDASFPDVDKGILVSMITPGSPAERAGFQHGDVVVEFDGKPVAGIEEVIDIMGDRVGVPLKVVVKGRNNVTITLTVTPDEAHPNM